MGELSERLRKHVTSRLPGQEPAIKNGAWQMMLDAADELDRMEAALMKIAQRDRHTVYFVNEIEGRTAGHVHGPLGAIANGALPATRDMEASNG